MISIPIVSLFCGAGGLDCGFRREGFRTILACDNSPTAIRTFNFNAKRKVGIETDLLSLRPTQVIALLNQNAPGIAPRGVIGGPPCQGFSRGNVHADPHDARNRLPLRYAAVLKKLNEKFDLDFFVFENVPGLAAPKHRKRFERIKQAFERAGFRVFQKHLDARFFGVPQVRHRLFVVGLNSTRFPAVDFEFPDEAINSATVRTAIGDLPTPTFFNRHIRPNDIQFHPNHWTMNPRSKKFTEGCPKKGRSFRQIAWDHPSPTVAYGNREIHVHPNGDRRLSVYEAMLLQGFPTSYRILGDLSAQVTQVCNAVPPPLARAIAKQLRRTLFRSTKAGHAQTLGACRAAADS